MLLGFKIKQLLENQKQDDVKKILHTGYPEKLAHERENYRKLFLKSQERLAPLLGLAEKLNAILAQPWCQS